jgi:hypothetical protein
MANEKVLHRCTIHRDEECIVTNLRILINEKPSGLRQIFLQELRSVGQSVEWSTYSVDLTMIGRTGEWRLYCKSRKEADVLAAKIKEAMLEAVS